MQGQDSDRPARHLEGVALVHQELLALCAVVHLLCVSADLQPGRAAGSGLFGGSCVRQWPCVFAVSAKEEIRSWA